MPNPRLTDDKLAQAHAILAAARAQLDVASAGDPILLFALRRKVQKELMHDERGTPAHRNRVKELKRAEQGNLCTLCGEPLPAKNAVLDRFEAVNGYTVENTRLIHPDCDIRVQSEKGYA